MNAIKSFMWVQSSAPTTPDCYIVNNKVIDASDDITRREATSLQLLDINPNLVNRWNVTNYNKLYGQNIEMRSSLIKGTIYKSFFIEERAEGRRLNYFYWCAPFQEKNLDKLLRTDASLINKRINSKELDFVRSITRKNLIYRVGGALLLISALIAILILLTNNYWSYE